MPLPVAHGLLGAGLVVALHPKPTSRYLLPLLAGACLANAPDLDFLLVFLLHSGGWHRGFSHSFTFALFVWLAFTLAAGRRRAREGIAYGLAFTSHGVLDFLTTRVGGGVELLWPFSSARLALRWAGLSEIPPRFTALEFVAALGVEFVLFTPLLLLAVALRTFIPSGADSAKSAV